MVISLIFLKFLLILLVRIHIIIIFASQTHLNDDTAGRNAKGEGTEVQGLSEVARLRFFDRLTYMDEARIQG